MKKPELAELPTKFVVAEIGSTGRWRRILIWSGLGLVVVAVGAFFGVRRLNSKDAATTQKMWSEVHACLLGPALTAGETPSGRLRGVQLAVLGTPKDPTQAVLGKSWPGTCAPAAYQLAEAATGDLEKSAKALADAIKDKNAVVHVEKEVEAVWADAVKAKLELKPAPDVAAAPAPVKAVYAVEALQQMPRVLEGELSLGNVRPEPALAGGLRFVVDDRGLAAGPVICAAERNKEGVTCAKVPADVAKLSPGIQLLGTTDAGAQPYFFAGESGSVGVYTPDGKQVFAGTPVAGAAVHADGSASFAKRNDVSKDVRVATGKGAGPFTERPLVRYPDLFDPHDTAVFWDWFVYVGAAKAPAPPHLFAAKLSEPGPAVDVGEFPEATLPATPMQPARPGQPSAEARFSACRSDEMIALRVRGANVDRMTFFVGGRWSAPIRVEFKGGTMACKGNEVVISHLQHAVVDGTNSAVLKQAKCNISGCVPTTVNLREILPAEVMPADEVSLAMADVGGAVALVWNGKNDSGLRMRIAPLDKLKGTPDTLLFDAAAPKAGVSTFRVTEVRALSEGTYGLVFVNTTEGARAFHTAADGKMAPLRAGL